MDVEHYPVHGVTMDGHPGSEEAKAEGLAKEGKKREDLPSFPAYQLISGVCLSGSSTGFLLLIMLGRKPQRQNVRFLTRQNAQISLLPP